LPAKDSDGGSSEHNKCSLLAYPAIALGAIKPDSRCVEDNSTTTFSAQNARERE